MHAKLIPIIGLDSQDEVGLSPSQAVTMGRGDSCTVRLMHSKVSRMHCRVCFENGFYSVEDFDSKNGTWVNSRRIHKAILFHHDRITVGGAEFRFVLDGSMAEESTHVPVEDDPDVAFETEYREPVGQNTPSSFFMDLPKGPEGSVHKELERDLSAVCKVINSVNAEHQLDRLLETIMDSVMEVTEADRGYLIAAKKVDGVLMPLVSRNREGIPALARNTFSRSIVSECYESGDSLLKSDPTSDYDASESVMVQQIQSIMCVPMRDEQGPVGVIYVDNVVGSRQFTKRDLRVLTAIGNQAGIALRRAQLSRQVEGLFRDAIRTIIRLVEVKDEYTYGHSERVTAVALRVTELLPADSDKPDLRDIEIAGLLHDVGKLAVRLDILRKPERLTDSEYRSVKKHPVSGASILSSVDNAEHIAAAVRNHHEWWDGSGYPDGLTREKIPLLARILAVADAFDSMASERPYKAVLPQDEILAELTKGAGTQFDPELVNLFINALKTNDVFRSRINAIYRHGSHVGGEGRGPFD